MAESKDTSEEGNTLNESFDLALERTREALEALSQHWKAKDVPGTAALTGAVDRILEDATLLSEEGFEWSKEVGLFHVLPREAMQAKPIKTSVPQDGLLASTAGGKLAPTHPSLLVGPAPPCGFGVFACSLLLKGTKLGEYVGEIRRYDIWCEEIKARKVAARGTDASAPFIFEELYAAWAGPGPGNIGVVVDAHACGNTMRFINCSCSPNCTFKSLTAGSQGHWRLEVETLRDIKPWEQLSVDYGWYFDEPTREDIQLQAMKAYKEDFPHLAELPDLLAELSRGQEAEEQAENTSPYSEAVEVLREALAEARRPCRKPRVKPASFYRRYVDPETLATFFERGGRLEAAATFREIPEQVWFLYEVVGAERVGVPCRCALDPSLNALGRCSGIIGRPMQAKCSGRDAE